MSKLTPKQSAFIDEYMVDLNATQAAIRAGYSEKTARSQGQRLLTNVDIANELQKRIDKRSERTEVTQDMVIDELAKIGFSNVQKLVTSHGGVINVEDMDEAVAASISSIEIVIQPSGEYDDDGGKIYENVKKIKLWDKQQALLNLGKHLGMFKERVDHKHVLEEAISDAFKGVADRTKQIGRQVRNG